MDDLPDTGPKTKYRWPWFLLSAVVLAVVLAVIWVGWEVRHVEQETNFSAPLPSQQ